MRVLLLGEFSSLHKYLKEGLKKIGVDDVQIAADSGGWKKIGGIDFPYPLCDGRNRLSRYRDFFRFIDRFKDYDVVQMVNTCVFPVPINKSLIKRIKKNNKILSLISAGGDCVLAKACRKGIFEYDMLLADQNLMKQFSKNNIRGLLRNSNDEYVANSANIIIPTSYNYYTAYKKYPQRCNAIPFPICLDDIKYEENIINNKIVFFHGINNEAAKGTSYIKAALNKLKNDYPNDVEIVINKRMPFEEYMKVMKRVNVVVDQTNGYGYGINACLSMAQGKVTMSCSKKENSELFHMEDVPVFDMEPNIEQIYNCANHILERKNEISRIGELSRRHIEKYHDCKLIAQRYVDAWNSL